MYIGKCTATARNKNKSSNTVVGDYINTMKTTFEFNFDLKHRIQENLSIKKASL